MEGAVPAGDSQQDQAERREGYDNVDGAEHHILG